MNSQQFQFQQYSPTEFEQFRAAVQQDGFVLTQNTIDTVSGHIGALTYLTGNYNRNQQVLTVTVKTSPWQSFQDTDLRTNITRIAQRDKTANEEGKTAVNQTPIKTPEVPFKSLGANKNIATPAIPPKQANQPATPAVSPETGAAKSDEPNKSSEPVKSGEQVVDLKTETSTDVNKPVPTQTPKPVETKPAEAATTPTK